MHRTPNSHLSLFTALQLPLNGSCVHKLSEQVFHVGVPLDPAILLLLFGLRKYVFINDMVGEAYVYISSPLSVATLLINDD